MSAQRRAGTKSVGDAGGSATGGTATVASRSTRQSANASGNQSQASTRSNKPTNDKGKQATAAQPSMIASKTESIRRLVRESYSEAKKVNWPDQDTTRNLTVVVIAISIVLGLLLGGIDYGLVRLLDVI